MLAFLVALVEPLPNTSNPISALLTYGPLGLFILGVLTGQIVPGWVHKRLQQQHDALRESVDKQLAPTLDKAAQALVELARRGIGGS